MLPRDPLLSLLHPRSMALLLHHNLRQNDSASQCSLKVSTWMANQTKRTRSRSNGTRARSLLRPPLRPPPRSSSPRPSQGQRHPSLRRGILRHRLLRGFHGRRPRVLHPRLLRPRPQHHPPVGARPKVHSRSPHAINIRVPSGHSIPPFLDAEPSSTSTPISTSSAQPRLPTLAPTTSLQNEEAPQAVEGPEQSSGTHGKEDAEEDADAVPEGAEEQDEGDDPTDAESVAKGASPSAVLGMEVGKTKKPHNKCRAWQHFRLDGTGNARVAVCLLCPGATKLQVIGVCFLACSFPPLWRSNAHTLLPRFLRFSRHSCAQGNGGLTTQTLWNHLNAKHKAQYLVLKPPPAKMKFASPGPQLSSSMARVVKLSAGAGSAAPVPVAPLQTYEDWLTRALYWVIMDEQPYSAVEQKTFRLLFPHLHLTCTADTIKNRLLKLYDCARRDLVDYFSKQQPHTSFYSVSSDLWTSPSEKSFMAVHLHYVDPNWDQVHSCTLDFLQVPETHTGANLAGISSAPPSGWSYPSPFTYRSLCRGSC